MRAGRFHLGLQLRLVLLTALIVSGDASAVRAQSAPTEYEVKAAYLYQFGKFVEWPEGSLNHGGDVFSICILGADPFGPILEETISGRSVQGKKPIARHLASPTEASDCNIMFISSSEQNHAAEILKALQGKSILIVGESGNFIAQGGMVQFEIEQNKVRFEINVAAVERANLKVSSQLLKVAKLTKG